MIPRNTYCFTKSFLKKDIANAVNSLSEELHDCIVENNRRSSQIDTNKTTLKKHTEEIRTLTETIEKQQEKIDAIALNIFWLV